MLKLCHLMCISSPFPSFNIVGFLVSIVTINSILAISLLPDLLMRIAITQWQKEKKLTFLVLDLYKQCQQNVSDLVLEPAQLDKTLHLLL